MAAAAYSSSGMIALLFALWCGGLGTGWDGDKSADNWVFAFK